jgi:superfamily I DNA/RNA helicase
MISLTSLNSPQQEAAATITGPVLILAGAGSGKTRTITYRMASMIENHGIPSSSILGVTFTNKAACEMKERMEQLVPPTRLSGITLSTFHSLGLKILKEEIHHLGRQPSFSIYDTGDQLALISEGLRHYRQEKQSFDRKVIISKIGFLKNQGITADNFAQSSYFDSESPYDLATEFVYHYYQEKLEFFNAIDFDDILLLSVDLFQRFPLVAQKYSQRFRYIVIDEYQDTNPLQFQLVLGLTSTHHNLCVVGDDDQAIYSFRGADLRNILEFEKRFPQTKVIRLEENYRSTMTILDLANKVIAQNKERKSKRLWTTRESPERPYLWCCGDTDHEAQLVAEDIVNYQKQGGSLNDIAIIYRSNTQAPPLEDSLRLEDLSYTMIGGQKFYDKKEVKDLLAYLAVFNNPYDEVSLRRILNVPHRGIGPQTLKKYIDLSQELKLTLFRAFDHKAQVDPGKEATLTHFTGLIKKYQKSFHFHSLSEGITQLIEEIDYLSYIDKVYHQNARQAIRRKQDILNFIESARRFERYHPHPTLKNFLEKIFLADSQDKNKEEESTEDRITMLTLHSSKGLEFNRVYLIGVEEDILPHKKVLRGDESVEEERRLCYVGITRAKKNLIMTYCKERVLYGKKRPRHKSRFLLQLDGYQEQDRTTYEHLSQEEAQNYQSNYLQQLISKLESTTI